MVLTIGIRSWKLKFARDLNDWEVDLVMNLLNALHNEKVTFEDKVSWKGVVGDSFSISNACKVLKPGKPPCFLIRVYGCLVSMLIQRFMHGRRLGERFLNLDKLQKRGWQLPNICYLCGCAEESVHHILLHCSMASSLWEIIFSLVGVHWVLPKTMKETLIS